MYEIFSKWKEHTFFITKKDKLIKIVGIFSCISMREFDEFFPKFPPGEIFRKNYSKILCRKVK